MAELERVLLDTQTTQERYQVIDRYYEGRPARVLFSGAGRAAQSGIGLDDNPDLLFDYNQRLLEISSALYPASILVIGGGAFTLPTALVTALPDAHIDVVELDSGLQPIAEQYFGLTKNPRLHLHFGDGREYVANTRQQYDLIILDVFSNLEVPKQFITEEWVKLVRKKLTRRGAVAMNIIASLDGRNSRLIKGLSSAYASHFKEVTIFPAAHGLTTWLPQNLVVVSERKPYVELPSYVRYAPLKKLEINSNLVFHDEQIIAS